MLSAITSTPEMNPADTILGGLRQATGASHDALHRHPLLIALAEGNATRSQLLASLMAFYGFYRSCDAVVSLSDFTEIKIAPSLFWMDQDLMALGLGESQIAALPVAPSLPPLTRPGEAMGLRYVLEGSALGGQVIARGLRLSLDAGPEAGYRYFSGYGPKETGARWRAFIAELTSLKQEEAADAMRYAALVFERLERWLWACHQKQ